MTLGRISVSLEVFTEMLRIQSRVSVFSLPKHTELYFYSDVEKSGMFQDVYHLVLQREIQDNS
jgi:hypothetical protein